MVGTSAGLTPCPIRKALAVGRVRPVSAKLATLINLGNSRQGEERGEGEVVPQPGLVRRDGGTDLAQKARRVVVLQEQRQQPSLPRAKLRPGLLHLNCQRVQ